MADDPFQDLLELEDGFYKQGYEAGVADSTYAGMIEGKTFGIEKGYEKALELAKMHGRAMVWNARLISVQEQKQDLSSELTRDIDGAQTQDNHSLKRMAARMDSLTPNARLQKHIESLFVLTDGATVKADNSDESVSELDDRLAKAKAKAKVIANIVGEQLNSNSTGNSSIEESMGLNARH